MAFVIFYRELEFVACDPLEVIATLSMIGSYFGYRSRVDIEQIFDRGA